MFKDIKKRIPIYTTSIKFESLLKFINLLADEEKNYSLNSNSQFILELTFEDDTCLQPISFQEFLADSNLFNECKSKKVVAFYFKFDRFFEIEGSSYTFYISENISDKITTHLVVSAKRILNLNTHPILGPIYLAFKRSLGVIYCFFLVLFFLVSLSTYGFGYFDVFNFILISMIYVGFKMLNNNLGVNIIMENEKDSWFHRNRFNLFLFITSPVLAKLFDYFWSKWQ